MPLQTLAHHNGLKMEIYEDLRKKGERKNGLMCPECDFELYDTNAFHTDESTFPPRRDVHCKHCNWQGQRIV
jgi:hypothetical protein